MESAFLFFGEDVDKNILDLLCGYQWWSSFLNSACFESTQVFLFFWEDVDKTIADLLRG